MIKDRAKRVCFVLFLLGIASLLFTENPAIETAHGSSFGPPASHTGAPLQFGGFEPTCTECHQTGFFVGATFSITAPAGYVPGQTYEVTVTHVTKDETRGKWGFQCTSLDTGFNQAGVFHNTTTDTQLVSSGLRQYIEHTFDGTFAGQMFGASWTFNWTAPVTDVGPVTFYAAGNQANNNGSPSGDQIYLAQATINPISCSYSISPDNAFFSVNGGSGGTSVTAGPSCNWTAQSNAGWISLTSLGSGTGSGGVTFNVAPNFTASARTGTLTVAGSTYTIVQDGGLGKNCTFVVSPASKTFGSAGGTDSFNVSGSLRCAWQAVSNSPWITILSGSAGAGTGPVGYQVAANAGTLGRVGTITVGGRTFTVKQKGN